MPVDVFHPPIIVNFTHHNITNCLPYTDYTYNWHAGDYIPIVIYLGSVNFMDYFYNNNIDSCLDLFYNHIRFSMDHYIPKIQKRNFDFSKWFSKELKIHIKQKKMAHDIYKYSNNIKNDLKFSNIRAKCKYLRYRDYTLGMHKKYTTQLKQILNFFGNSLTKII